MLRAKGLLAEEESKWNDAADAYTAALVQEPGNSFALGHRAIVLAEAKRDDEALADAAAALAKAPGWYGLRQVRAGIFFKRHQCDQITKDAKATSDNAENDQGAFVLAARLYVLCKQRAEGFAVFDKALAIKPAASIYINRATSRLPSDGAGRLADIDAAIKLEPKDAGWVSFKADEVDRQGNAAKALELYEEALKLEPDSFGIGVKRAGLMHRLGRKDEAAKLFASLRTRAKDATMLNSLCWEKATDGILLDSALTDCNDALRMSPSSAAIMDSLGMTLLRLGRYDDAIKAYDKAIAGGTGAISLMGRSIAYAEKGDKSQSDADRKEALSQDPEIASRAQRYGLKF
jgi:tetratricopeptide (TPR) repeat protein